MRKHFVSTMLLSLALVTPAPAADQTRMHAKAEAIELMLLRQTSVRHELKIDADLGKKIFEFTHKQQQQAMDVHKLGEAEQGPKWEAMIHENNEFLKKNLTPEQHKLPQTNRHADVRPGLDYSALDRARLGLTEEQMQKAKKAQDEAHEKIAKVIHAASSEGRNEKLAELRHTSHEEFHKILTEEQRKKWKELAGEPFAGKLLYEEIQKDK